MSTLCYALRNNQIFNGPFEYNESLVKSILMKNGADPRKATPVYSKPIISNNISILRQEEIKPVFNADIEFLTISSNTITDTAVRIEYAVESKSIDEIFTNKERKLAHYHEVFDMGFTIYQDVKIKTDVEARVNAIGVVNAMASGDLTETIWNGIGGQVYLNDLQDARALHQSILVHINKGFHARSALLEEMRLMDIDQLKELNVLVAYRDKLEAIEAYTGSLESQFNI